LQERYQPKFFSLPKISIGSSRAACSALLRPPQRASARFDHATIEFEKCLQLKCLLKKLLVAPFCVGALVASREASSIVGRHQVRRALARLRVNTSLSRTLFFLVRWCIRVEVHLDSRVHEEGSEEDREDRGEEDCQEDQEGLQEEVTDVSRSREMSRRL
jgi:hypothetical protein